MKKIYFLLIALLSFVSVNAQIINIADANFKAKLLAASPSNTIAKDLAGNYFTIDANYDGQIQNSEALQVSSLDVSLSNITDLTGIEFFVNLKILKSYGNQLSNLNVLNLKNLSELDCKSNQLLNLRISGLTNLSVLNCSKNQLATLDVTGLNNLLDLDFSTNKMLTMNLSSLTNLVSIKCNTNQLTSLNVTGLKKLNFLLCYDNQLTSLDISDSKKMFSLSCSTNKLSNLNVSGLIELRNLECFKNQLINLDVSSLIKLSKLNCANNNILSLDVSASKELIDLNCSDNKLSSLNVSGLTNLSNFYCVRNQLTNLDISGLINLNTFFCYTNQLTNLDVSSLKNLYLLSCYDNKLSSLHLNNLMKLNGLYCDKNLLASLDVSGLVNLAVLSCSANKLSSLDVSVLNKLQNLSCQENSNLTKLFIKNNNKKWSFLDISKNPNLEYICADEEDLMLVQQKINENGYNCHVNSYCLFSPSGIFYTIKGNNKFDSNSNGCDVNDFICPNLKFNFTDGSNSGTLISNNSGNYSIPTNTGTYTLTPILENPNYFTISPSSVNVSFPTQTSPFTQDFCITPNGVHSDVELKILPVTSARPGFDAKYKIIYKNKGNQVENGSISLNFDDSKMDFVSAGNAPTQSTGSLTWNYTNLQPFETKTIDVVFNINSPMETPAVNGGDVLSYTTTITSGNTDETPNDNSFVLNQTVVNSFDPNDITCLEGAKVSTSKIGDYVHYIIRFENTGSANATNIVVKDVVDAAKYDVNSIVPINGSHDFYTRINGNNVEFIFENINLPFADATNDGYVAFKIKTKSTLVTGDTFSKNANIYFDYNFPIVTNTATTTIAALSNQDFEFKNYFALYPNPVNDRLTIETKNSIEVSSINIYNTLGQLVLVIPNAQDVKTVDVSILTSGNYFIKINSDKGTSNTKFIKN